MRSDVLLLLAATVGAGAACSEADKVWPEGPMIDPETTSQVYSETFLEAVHAPAGAAEAVGAPGLRRVTVDTYYPQRRSFRVTVDAADQVVRIDTPTEHDYGDERGTAAATLYPSFAAAGLEHDSFLGAAVFGLKAKAFDDGLYAAVELAAEPGVGRLPGRKALLKNLLAVVPPAAEGGTGALALLAAAARLAGEPAAEPPQVETESARLLTEFLGNEMRSNPIGFYTWSRELAHVFQRDRMLQTALEKPEAEALAAAIASDAGLEAAYGGMLRLAERLTNPFAYPDLRAAATALSGGQQPTIPDPVHFLPPSRSHETELVKRLFGNRPIPDGFDLADELVEQIRAGTVDLAPTRDSGWYDHQAYALESLVIPEQMPEGQHLRLTDSYRKDLVGLFKALLALTRETHVKQLEIPSAGAAAPGDTLVLEVRPSLTVEPLATFYLRRARSYRFVRGVLEEACGPEALAGLFRLTAGGPVNLPLPDELRLMEALCHGAYLTTCAELGVRPEAVTDLGLGMGPTADQALFGRWVAQIQDDPDLCRDVRMMVPVFYDVGRKKLKVWAVLGVASKPLSVSFEQHPTVLAVEEITDGAATAIPLDRVRVEFAGEGHRLGYLVTAELYVTRPLNREQFRAHCFRYRTAQAILENLE